MTTKLNQRVHVNQHIWRILAKEIWLRAEYSNPYQELKIQLNGFLLPFIYCLKSNKKECKEEIMFLYYFVHFLLN